MAISLKEQLQQREQLKEISYHAPIFDKNYYEAGDHNQGKQSGKRMFYDFYAMEFLWSFLGSGAISRTERERKMDMDPDDPRRDIVMSPAYKHLPDAAVRMIDNMYEQVTNTISKNLLSYVRLAVVQEFQYLVQYSSGWTGFRNSIVARYNKKKTITKQDFDELVNQYIPDMSQYPAVIKRLLKYSKYFSEMHTSDDKDPFDVARNSTSNSSKDEPFVAEPEAPQPSNADAPSDLPPDETDYDAPPTEREFGKYGPDNPSPYDQDWAGNAAFNDVPLPKIPSDDDEDDDDDLTAGVKERLTEEYINPTKIRNVYAAINKAGITLDDIEKAYNNIPWDGSYGGPKWGAGAVALLKLSHAKKNLSTEDMNHIIDHIYDLQHNTGSLLNKGPMYVSDSDLNRRYKFSDIARFIPFVSPVIKNLILRFHRFLHTDPARADQEANMEKLLKSPKIPMEDDQIAKLSEMGFHPTGDNTFRVAIKFTNKKKEEVSGVYYEIGKYDVGEFDKDGKFQKKEGSIPKFVVYDNLRADVKAFDTFEEAYGYLNGYKADMIKHGYTGASAAAAIKSEKDLYIDSHTKIKLSSDREQELLNINVGWRKKSKRYKAYFTDGHRVLFYAFSDSTFLSTNDYKGNYKVFNDWPSALAYLKDETKTAMEYPNKEFAQAEINAELAGKSLSPSVASSQEKDYFLEPDAQNELTTLLSTELPQFKYEKYLVVPNPDGMVLVKKQKYHVETSLFSVGQKLGSSLGKPFKVVHYVSTAGPGGAMEAWPFGTWENTLDFIKQNISQLVNAGLSKPLPLNKQTAQKTASGVIPALYHGAGSKPLPPYSPAQSSYMVHVGIQTPPKHTIRLTKEDEDKLVAIGFEPRMIGEDVWYIHKFSSDTVKFFPNNTAKILFTSKGSATKVPKIDFSISKILAWLPTKYSLQTTKSPIDTGASISSTPPAGMIEKGIKAGTMFENTIKNAGFTWDDATSQYKDGTTILKIAPNRSSVITFNTKSPDVSPVTTTAPEKKYFADLASLITYLKDEYPTQKKSSSIISEKEWPLAPGALTDALKNANFKYIGPSGIIKTDNGQKSGWIFENPSPYDRVIFYNDASSVVFIDIGDTDKELRFKDADKLIEWINSHYKATEGKITNYPSWVSKELLELLERGRFKYSGPVMASVGKAYGYENGAGDEVVLFSYPYAEVRNSNNPNHIEVYNSIQDLLLYMNSKFGPSVTNPLTNKIEFKNLVGQSKFIPVNDQDAAAKAGFLAQTDSKGIFYTHSNGGFKFRYYKNGIRIESKKGIQEVNLAPEDAMSFWANFLYGLHEESTVDEIEKSFHDALLTGPEKRFEKIIRMAVKEKGTKLPADQESELDEKGFYYNANIKAYISDDLFEAIVAIPSNPVRYILYWLNEHGEIFRTDTTDWRVVLHNMGSDGNIAITKNFIPTKGITSISKKNLPIKFSENELVSQLKSLGFHSVTPKSEVEFVKTISHVPGGIKSMHQVHINDNGTADYIKYVEVPSNPIKKVKSLSSSIPEMIDYLKETFPLKISTSNIPASPDIHNELVNNYKFEYDTDGKYRKFNQTIAFYSDGVIIYQYISHMGEAEVWNGSWKPEGIPHFMNKLAELNVDIHSTPNPPPQPTKASSNKESDDKPPFSNFDYVLWGKSAKHNPKATIVLIDSDDKFMRSMGYTPEYTDSTGTPPLSYVYKNKLDGSSLVFYLSGTVLFISKKGKQINYPSIKQALEWVWSTHNPDKQTPSSKTKTPKKENFYRNLMETMFQ